MPGVQIIERMFKKLNLFSVSSMKVLHALSADPIRFFYQREVAEEARLSVGSANRVLKISEANAKDVTRRAEKFLKTVERILQV